MPYKPRSARASADLQASFPPRADQVAGCPPHFWRLEAGWQSCNKCGQRQEIVRQEFGHSRGFQRSPKTGTPAH